MMALLKRLALVAFAYAVASVFTGYAVDIYSFAVGDDTVLPGPRPRHLRLGDGLALAFFIALFAAVPAGFVVALSERFTLRSPFLFAATGSLIGLALGTMFSPPKWFPWFGLCFGPVSGLMYWSIAGRTAGLAETWQRNVVAAFALIPVALLVANILRATIMRLLGW